MTDTTRGRFWAVGVGPGDPELLTLKAVRIIQQADIIYHAGPQPEIGRALETVRGFLRPEQPRKIVLRTGMNEVQPGEWRRYYRDGVTEIAADCQAGRNVVFITEGDPTLYSTAIYVWQLLAELFADIPIEVVPGVTSVTAAAARVQWPLAQRDEPLLILPGNYRAEDVTGWLTEFPSLCLMKPAKQMPRLVEELQGQGESVYVEEAGTPREWLTRDLVQAVGRHQYFSLLLHRHQHFQNDLLARSASEGSQHPGREPHTGQVTVVGIGPGAQSLLTQQALDALRNADAIIGYAAYLRLLAPLKLRAELLPHPIGAEAERARQALELAAAGRRVALVSSGDAGVYGMASLLLETAGDIDVQIVPGITAALAAAALLGAPLGHDFACISLSDLLTPWEVIEQRLKSAGQGDFVVALYNPISQRRIWQLPRARAILLTHRQPQAPVGLVDKAHRPGMKIWHTTLGELTTDGVGMETIVIIGNSQTRIINGRLVTPRGYTTDCPSGGRKPLVHPSNAPTQTARPPLAREIIEESFAIIDRELGTIQLPPWAHAVVRRMIHASADFEFAKLLCYSTDLETAMKQALADGLPIITDTEMVLTGIRTALANSACRPACYLNDPETSSLAEANGLTRSAAGIHLAAKRHSSPVVVIGNAPTALDETLRLAEAGEWRPAAIIGMPVGFVGVVEAKGRLLAQTRVPYLSCSGRKGGSAVAAAALNALAELYRS